MLTIVAHRLIRNPSTGWQEFVVTGYDGDDYWMEVKKVYSVEPEWYEIEYHYEHAVIELEQAYLGVKINGVRIDDNRKYWEPLIEV